MSTTDMNILAGYFKPTEPNSHPYASHEWLMWEFGTFLANRLMDLPETAIPVGDYGVKSDGKTYLWFRTYQHRAEFRIKA